MRARVRVLIVRVDEVDEERRNIRRARALGIIFAV